MREKDFNSKYKMAGRKRAESLREDYWNIDDVLEYFNSKNIPYTHIDGESEVSIPNRYATKTNMGLLENKIRFMDIKNKNKNTVIIIH